MVAVAKKASSEFAPHQKAIAALLPRLQKAQKGEAVEFSEAEKAQQQAASAAGAKLLALAGIFPAAIAEQLKTMTALARAASSTSQKVANTKQQQDLPPKIVKRSLNFVPARIEFFRNGKLDRTEAVIATETTQPLVLKLVGGIPLSREDNPQAFDEYRESSGICITGHDRTKKALTYKETFDLTMQAPAIDLQISWYGDGEQEFPIFINGKCDDCDTEIGRQNYWGDAPQVAEVIKNETGSSLNAEDALFLDGNTSMSALDRLKAGKQAAIDQAPALFAKLAKDKNGKIIQRIQVYTHTAEALFMATSLLNSSKSKSTTPSIYF